MSLCTVKECPAVPRFRTRTHSRSAALCEMQDRTLAVWPPEKRPPGGFGRPPRSTSLPVAVAIARIPPVMTVTVPAIAIVAVPVA